MGTTGSSIDQFLTLPSSEQSELQLQSPPGATHMSMQCVGSLQVQGRLQLGFLCGSIPVPTDNEAMMCGRSVVEAAIVPAITLQNDRIIAPQYQMLPNQTDLNTILISDLEDEHFLPMTLRRAPEGVDDLCKAWGQNYHSQPLARKCEALAVSALAGYGDKIDVVAPVEILKKIFKIPYSKARLSIAVHRVGQTLILNTGPDVEEGENLVRTKKQRAKAMERALFLKFAMQSVRAEACDCPVTQSTENHNTPNFTSKSMRSTSSNDFEDNEKDSLDNRAHATEWQYMNDLVDEEKRNDRSTILDSSKDGLPTEHRQSFSWDRNNVSGISSCKRSSFMGEKQRDSDCIQSEPGNHKRSNNDGFVRVLFWQLEEMRMLLGSDLLLFSNEKHVAVSLHLWEIERQVTPLMWLDAWLDNVMASVPELAVCYHHNGIIQGYELLKTDDIFLLKGLSEDGTSFFHPHIIRQNALSVLRFLQENCKNDLGTYWLFKNAGEDLVQLFDLSVITNNCTTTTQKDEEKVPLPSHCARGKGSCSLPLGILLYRLAHRLSLSKDPSDRCKCASFFKKCLELLGEQEHLFVRASAHEHVARLILKCHEDLGPLLLPFMLEPDEYYDVASKSFIEHTVDPSQSAVSEKNSLVTVPEDPEHNKNQTLRKIENLSISEKLELEGLAERDPEINMSCLENPCDDEAVSKLQNSIDQDHGSSLKPGIPQNPFIPVSARLAAVHHASQAIKALRCQRQLQDVESKDMTSDTNVMRSKRYLRLVPVCIYGEIDCIEYCDIRECEFGPFMDQKLVQLVLLLGESYLALGQAYKDDRQLNWALKAVELACFVYESMHFHWMNNITYGSQEKSRHLLPVPSICPSNVYMHVQSGDNPQTFCQPVIQESPTARGANKDLFWSQAWILVGDIYVEYQRAKSSGSINEEVSKCNGPTMAQEVVKEVKRLRKKLSHNKKNCTVCSLGRCSCESDRANSGSNASSSSSSVAATKLARKHGKKLNYNSLEKNNKSKFDDLDWLSEHQTSLNSCQENLDKNVGTNTNLFTVDKENEPQKNNKGDIFSFIGDLNDLNKENNLQKAAECYDAAARLLSKMWGESEEMKCVLRKKGWIYNEIGRIKLDSGNIEDAQMMFDKAIGAFKEVQDQVNVVLIYCNIGHGQRAAAEALVSQLDAWRDNGLYEEILKKVFDDAVSLYSDSLKSYNTAKSELKLIMSVSDIESIDLRNEVFTQCAHTYLRLGMLLAMDHKNGGHPYPRLSTASRLTDYLGVDHINSEKSQSKRINVTCNDSIREAITLYESLGSLRAQESAFAHFQLACYHRDCCTAIIRSQSRKQTEVTSSQQLKRYVTLAERHWLKSLKYYKPSTYPDMFLEILMQKSALNVAVSSSSSSYAMLEVALTCLLEGRHVRVSEGLDSVINGDAGNKDLKPSHRVLAMFSQQLQNLLRTMLATAQKMQKSNLQKPTVSQAKNNQIPLDSDDQGEGQKPGLVADVEKLKVMYRFALKSGEVPDLKGLYEIWMK